MIADERYHTISLRTRNARLYLGEVLLDGKPIKGLKSITINAEINLVTVQLTMVANVDYRGEARLE